ncbi:MAG: exodeoxyribonuclease VII large subunit, partial [Lentisphaeria bacterium]
TQARQLGIKNGMQVEALGMLSVYEPRGTYQINLRRLVPVGAGSLLQQFEALKMKLQAKGFFDPERKRPIPLMPSCVGLITSLTGAALQDFLQIANRRFKGLHIRIFPAQVQGPSVEEDVCRGIEFFNRTLSCDVIVITRGGGSQEDLWAFNSERIAEAIFCSNLPIISAIGHEIDFTIPDFVADLRVPTPSAAAELVCAHQAELANHLNHLNRRLYSSLQLKTSNLRHRLEKIKHSPMLAQPLQMVHNLQQRVDEIKWRLNTTLRYKLESEHKKVENLKQMLRAFNPENILQRGYALALDNNGMVVKDIDQVTTGQNLNIKIANGSIQTCVTKLEK